jgi:hypothetical protein
VADEKWLAVTLTDILPDGFADFVSGASAVNDTVGSLLETAADATNLVAGVLSDLADFDPGAALILALRQMGADLSVTGGKLLPLWDLPLTDLAVQDSTGKRWHELEGFASAEGSFDFFLRKIATSIFDEADPQRPQSEGTVAGLVMCIGAPTLQELVVAYQAVLKLFPSNAEIQRILDLLNRRLDPPAKVVHLTGSRHPDWHAYTLEDMWPGFRDLVDLGEQFIQLITPAVNASSAILRASATLADKAARMVTQAQAMSDAVSDFLALLGTSGVYFLPVYTGNGVQDWSRRVQQATDRPPFAALAGNYVAGAALVVEGPGAGTFKELTLPISLTNL